MCHQCHPHRCDKWRYNQRHDYRANTRHARHACRRHSTAQHSVCDCVCVRACVYVCVWVRGRRKLVCCRWTQSRNSTLGVTAHCATRPSTCMCVVQQHCHTHATHMQSVRTMAKDTNLSLVTNTGPTVRFTMTSAGNAVGGTSMAGVPVGVAGASVAVAVAGAVAATASSSKEATVVTTSSSMPTELGVRIARGVFSVGHRIL